MIRFYFRGRRGCGTWLEAVSIDATDPFNAALRLAEKGWRDLKLLAQVEVAQLETGR